MTAQHRVAARWIPFTCGSVWDDPTRAGWWTAYGLMLSVSIGMFGRRLAGRFDHAPPSGVFLATAVMMMMVFTALRRSKILRGKEPADRWSCDVLSGLLSASGMVLLLAITLPDAPLGAAIASWSCVVAAEAGWWTMRLRSRVPPVDSTSPGSSSGVSSSGVSSRGDSCPPGSAERAHRHRENGQSAPAALAGPLEHAGAAALAELDGTARGPEDEILPAEVTQQLTRTRTEEGGERLYGCVRADLVAGERVRAVHVMFCPPLSKVPEFSAEPSEGPPATVEITQLAPYGARLELKLERPAADAASVVVQFQADCPP